MRHVFVDSGGFFALLVSEDAFHARAKALFTQATNEPWFLVTTNAVIYETHALLTNRVRAGRNIALRFLDAVEMGMCDVVRVGKADEAHAITIVRSHQDKGYSLCDALSFVVMERLGIQETIAFDRHFREYGKFTLL